jgi:hypothetical protein
VVDHAPLDLDLDLADREVALEVAGVVEGVPEAEFDGAEQREVGRRRAVIGDRRPPDLEGLAERNEVRDLDLDAGPARADDRVAQAVAAAIVVELGPRGLPRRRPELFAVPVTDVQVAATGVRRNPVVAVAGQPSEPGITVERVAAGGVGDDPEELLAAEVVDPWERGVRLRDDVFASLVVELSETRQRSSSSQVGMGDANALGQLRPR